MTISTDMTPNTRPDEGRTSPQETKLAGNGETVADEAVDLAVIHAFYHDTARPFLNYAVLRPYARAALEAAGYFALRGERDALLKVAREQTASMAGMAAARLRETAALAAERAEVVRLKARDENLMRQVITLGLGKDSALAAERERAEANERDATALRAFAHDVMGEWPENCGVDGFEIQDLAEKHGLLRPEERTESCGEGCQCEAMSADWPTQCYRFTELYRGAALSAQEGK
jgi:hypothetical protein